MEGRKGQKGIWEAEKQTTENIYYAVLKTRVRGCQESRVRLEKHTSIENSSWGNRHKQLQHNFVDCVQFLRVGNQKKKNSIRWNYPGAYCKQSGNLLS